MPSFQSLSPHDQTDHTIQSSCASSSTSLKLMANSLDTHFQRHPFRLRFTIGPVVGEPLTTLVTASSLLQFAVRGVIDRNRDCCRQKRNVRWRCWINLASLQPLISRSLSRQRYSLERRIDVRFFSPTPPGTSAENDAGEWWKVVARTMRTVSSSCFRHERSQRSRGLLAAPHSRSTSIGAKS